ncbi:MAG: hypothetical protein NTY66_02080 [Candidatus Vogelbacteria bacterium]|nr:hypothetical protein [Candidatus Vogelbacteria bacterium]
MRFGLIFGHYFWWHYTTGIADLARNGANFASFLWTFFSINHLLAHFFSPFRRLGERYPDHFNFAEYFNAFIVNSLMRVVGAISRVVLIVFGLLCLAVYLVVFVAMVVFWLVLPLVALFAVVLGVRLLIS